VRRILLILIFFIAGTARAQVSTQPAPAKIDPPGELDKLKQSCGAFKFIGCAEVLFTGKPVHIAVGSLAPQNGFGAGLAYVGHKTTENWRTSWNADAVGTMNASWRAGFYLKFVDSREKDIGHHFGTQGQKIKPNLSELPEHPVINLYVQAISLNKLMYFGMGPNTNRAGRSFYGMTETIVGASAVKPFSWMNAGLYGEINGRFVDIRASHGQSSGSIEQLYTEVTAPGLTSQPGTLQFGEGVRMRPVFFDDFLRLNYDLAYRQYFTPGASFSFQRLTVDLSHQFALYKQTTRIIIPRDSNGPDECSLDTGSKHPECPAITRDLEGSVGLRLFTALSMTPGGNALPIYFQPTLGGGDINGNPSLGSYQDYRFRAPNVLLLRESFEHSIWKLPVGVALMADEGKVSLTRGDLGSSPWVHSFSAGLTLRAGGFPQVWLLFSWGGNEGTRTIVQMNNSLLGGSTRPSLY
jgi:hypothetical protein